MSTPVSPSFTPQPMRCGKTINEQIALLLISSSGLDNNIVRPIFSLSS